MAAPSFDEFMVKYRTRIEAACTADTYGDLTTDRDDRSPITVRAMNVVTKTNLEIFGEIAVFADRKRLVRLLQHLTGEDSDDDDDTPYNVLNEAHHLLEQLT